MVCNFIAIHVLADYEHVVTPLLLNYTATHSTDVKVRDDMKLSLLILDYVLLFL